MKMDLKAYFARIGHKGSAEPSLQTLSALHALHPAHIAFEGLDPFLGRPVKIDPQSIQAKLVGTRRGGYCFEHNGLFHDILAQIGFTVTPLAARVVWMSALEHDAPLTHRFTLVRLADGAYIADVGFGGQHPTAPLRLEPGRQQQTSHGTYRVMQEGEVYETQLRLLNRWAPMYRFTLKHRSPVDFEVANWFTSTYPGGTFTRSLMAAMVVGDTRVTLLNTTLNIRDPDGHAEQRSLDDANDLRHVLEATMGLALPAPAAAIWARLTRESGSGSGGALDLDRQMREGGKS